MQQNSILTLIDAARRADIACIITPYEAIADTSFVQALLGDHAVNIIRESGYPASARIPWSAERLSLYPINELASRQAGYRHHALTGKPEEAWPKGHWVFADWSSDPFTIGPDHAVFYARHGMGSWKPTKIFPDITAFFEAIAIWIEFFIIDNEREIFDEDFLILPEKLADLEMRLAKIDSLLAKEDLAQLFVGELP